jgi:hypothetical protein
LIFIYDITKFFGCFFFYSLNSPSIHPGLVTSEMDSSNKGKYSLLLIADTKLDSTFIDNLFVVDGYKLQRRDRRRYFVFYKIGQSIK